MSSDSSPFPNLLPSFVTAGLKGFEFALQVRKSAVTQQFSDIIATISHVSDSLSTAKRLLSQYSHSSAVQDESRDYFNSVVRDTEHVLRSVQVLVEPLRADEAVQQKMGLMTRAKWIALDRVKLGERMGHLGVCHQSLCQVIGTLMNLKSSTMVTTTAMGFSARGEAFAAMVKTEEQKPSVYELTSTNGRETLGLENERNFYRDTTSANLTPFENPVSDTNANFNTLTRAITPSSSSSSASAPSSPYSYSNPRLLNQRRRSSMVLAEHRRNSSPMLASTTTLACSDTNATPPSEPPALSYIPMATVPPYRPRGGRAMSDLTPAPRVMARYEEVPLPTCPELDSIPVEITSCARATAPTFTIPRRPVPRHTSEADILNISRNQGQNLVGEGVGGHFPTDASRVNTLEERSRSWHRPSVDTGQGYRMPDGRKMSRRTWLLHQAEVRMG